VGTRPAGFPLFAPRRAPNRATAAAIPPQNDALDDRRRKLSPRRRYHRANDRCFAASNAAAKDTSPTAQCCFRSRMLHRDSDPLTMSTRKPLFCRLGTLFKFCIVIVNARASRAAAIEFDRLAHSQITRLRDRRKRSSNYAAAQPRGATFRLQLQALACKHRLERSDSEPGIRRPEICRLRLASASGISALPEMWPSG
jgi:hypothetical protein